MSIFEIEIGIGIENNEYGVLPFFNISFLK